MQKRKPGRPHKGWKAAVRKSSVRSRVKKFLGVVAEMEVGIRKGHTPWNDPDHHRASDDGMPDHDAGVPSNANEVLNGDYIPWPGEHLKEVQGAIDAGWVADGDDSKERAASASKIVSGIKRQRDLPKGPSVDYEASTPPYPWQATESAKLRERLTDCFTLLAKAIEKAAATIVAGREVPEPPAERPEFTWNLVGPGTPLGAWLETKITRNALVDEHNICMCRIASIGDDPEWIEKEGGRTTVTHHSFAPPTHWRWPVS